MIILHPFSTGEYERKRETWGFVGELKHNGYEVESRNVDGPMDYPDLLKEFWGRDELVILEDDKVPTLADFKELIECKHAYCCFPYPVSMLVFTTMSLWRYRFPYSLGFVKFSKVVQQNVPASEWYREGLHWGLDGMIERPMIQQYGPFHLHETWIKHNHPHGLVKMLKLIASRAIAKTR